VSTNIVEALRELNSPWLTAELAALHLGYHTPG